MVAIAIIRVAERNRALGIDLKELQDLEAREKKEEAKEKKIEDMGLSNVKVVEGKP